MLQKSKRSNRNNTSDKSCMIYKPTVGKPLGRTLRLKLISIDRYSENNQHASWRN